MTIQDQKPITDLSPRVVQLAREIDRLVPGSYEIAITKPDLRQQDWVFEIVKKEKITGGNLSHKSNFVELGDNT